MSAAWYAKTLQRFKLADIGEGIQECEIIKWNVKPGDTVQAFDQLCEVQSDKASVEITSPFDGVVKELLVDESAVAKVGEGLCIIETDDGATEMAGSTAVEPAEEPARPPPHPEQERAQVKQEAAPSAATAPSPEKNPDLAPTQARRPHPMDPNQPTKAAPALGRNDADVLATPATRHFARQKGVDLAQVAPGSGKGGRVERADVEVFLSRASKESTSAATSTSVPSGEDVIAELGRTRYSMWKAMEKSLEIPHFGYTTYLDVTRLHEMLPLLNAGIPKYYLTPNPPPEAPAAVSPSSVYPAPAPLSVPEGGHYTKLTYLPILLKMLSRTMLAWPLFRSSITPPSTDGSSGKPTLTIRPGADITVALSTPTGLYTPTLRNVERSSAYALASSLRALAHRGRQVPCALTPADMPRRGGTLTLSNVGAIGAGVSAHPVLVPGGGVAIAALGRAQWVWDVTKNEKGERRLHLPVSWSADHRIIEGAEMAAFVEEWRSWVENPERMIAEGI